MASSPLEKRTTMVSAGRLPSSKLLETSSSRPFVHQACITYYAVRSGRYDIHVRVCWKVRSTLSSPLTMNSKPRSANSTTQITTTIHRVLLSLRYTNRSENHLVFPGVCFCRLPYCSFCPQTSSSFRTSDAHVASTGAFLPDAWSCREGSVILSAGKETFESLGLPGTKISAQMPGAPEQYRMSDHA
jgi:hypothetical protein